MIKNIVFDVGKVLVYFEPDWIMDKLGYDDEKKGIIKKAAFHSDAWEEGDRGELSEAELRDMFVVNAPQYEAEIRECCDRVDEAITSMPFVVEWMEDLKSRGYHLYVISNYREFVFEKTKHCMAFIPYMDGMLFSYQYKLKKPEREIYEQLLKDYDLKAEECVFIDDRQENVDGAKAVGYQGIVFHSYEQAKEELDALLSE